MAAMMMVVVIVFPLSCCCERVLYQIRFWSSTLQEPVGSRPSEHSLPSCGSDARGASGAVADVVGEACDCHCVALVVLYVSHYIYLIVISKAHTPP